MRTDTVDSLLGGRGLMMRGVQSVDLGEGWRLEAV